MFDHREIFAFTLVEYIDREEPEYIHITTKMGVPLDLEYEEDLYIELANYFRKENWCFLTSIMLDFITNLIHFIRY